MSRFRDGGWLAAIVPQPGPRSPAAARVWRTLDESARRRLRRAATDPRSAGALADATEQVVVRDLATSRAALRAADVAVPVLTGLLVLSTLWGFGRAAYPAAAGWWLLAGIVGLAATVAVGVHHAATRRRAATAALAALPRAGDGSDRGGEAPLPD